MMRKQEYIPAEYIEEAREFLKQLSEDAELFRQMQKFGLVGKDDEADAFCAYMYMDSFARYPHALITLYEAHAEIDRAFGPHDAQNVDAFLLYRMKSYYRLLKENGMI